MQRIFNLLLACFLTATVTAQSSDFMSYQAVVRDAGNKLIKEKEIGIRINILQGSGTGTVVYSETFKPVTNAYGIITLEIGNGTTEDDFFAIPWSENIYFIKTEADTDGGTNYTVSGVSQLLSVPYAFHAKKAMTNLNMYESEGRYYYLNGVPVSISDFKLDANSAIIYNLADPVDANDAATKSYVDAIMEGISIKLKELEER